MQLHKGLGFIESITKTFGFFVIFCRQVSDISSQSYFPILRKQFSIQYSQIMWQDDKNITVFWGSPHLFLA